MSTNEQKAQQLIAEAEKKVSSKGFFGSLFGGSSRIEDAVECYQRAANLFKMAKNWQAAGSAFCEAANLHARSGVRHDAATNYVDAANCYKKADINEAIKCLLKAVDCQTELGRFITAGKLHKTIAELYENDAIDYENAVIHYEEAALYFWSEDSHVLANQCMLKIAHYAVYYENYEKGIFVYKELFKLALKNNVLLYNPTTYIFRAALCHLMRSVESTRHELEGY
nr:unnamed protein product [Callosobruchus chinensis]